MKTNATLHRPAATEGWMVGRLRVTGADRGNGSIITTIHQFAFLLHKRGNKPKGGGGSWGEGEGREEGRLTRLPSLAVGPEFLM